MNFPWLVNVRFVLLLFAASFASGATVSVVTAQDSVSTLLGEQATAFQGGYILHREEVSGTVVGSRDAKTLFANGDILYLKLTSAVRVGDRVTLYRPTIPVFHPATQVMMGRLIKVLGVVEIVRPPVNGVAEARVLRAFDSIAIGDPVMPFVSPPVVPSQNTSQTPVTGMIVEFKEPRQVTGQDEIVYLDLGSQDGVALGDRFQVIRRGRRSVATLPDTTLGELKIIGLQQRTSTARVVQSSDALRRGDLAARLPGNEKFGGDANEERVVNALAAIPQNMDELGKRSDGAKKELQNIYFDFNKWDASDKDLSETAALLKEQPSAKVLIEGHADERGSREYNLVLAEKRAKEIERYLMKLGLKNPMSVHSFGKERPVCTEDTESCHAKNRRVGLTLDGQ